MERISGGNTARPFRDSATAHEPPEARADQQPELTRRSDAGQEREATTLMQLRPTDALPRSTRTRGAKVCHAPKAHTYAAPRLPSHLKTSREARRSGRRLAQQGVEKARCSIETICRRVNFGFKKRCGEACGVRLTHNRRGMACAPRIAGRGSAHVCVVSSPR